MRVSTRGQYAVRAMVDLACNWAGKPVSLESISKREFISISYLEQLFLKLRRRKLVKSVRGPGGGYLLGRSAAEITIAEVIEAVEEPLSPVPCVDTVRCDWSEHCVAHEVWRELGDRIKGFLNSLTIADLVARYQDIQRRRLDASNLYGPQRHYACSS